ncbi:hemolysin-III related-domain-containing protein [Paraphysoderma sedebokerense]|nr:hemolysin-III related-domain-containing protein [Paraphysoderma sedebokerense]
MFSVWATPRFRLWRTLIYIASGVLSGLPVLHYLIQFGVPDVTGWALYGWFVMGFTYIFGAMIYAFKIPECFAPGKFDFIGHSHQWWHICVVAAAYVHYISSVELLSWRLTQGCPV